jgi:HSP20 family protein
MIRWNPVREWANLRAMDRFFDETWRAARPVTEVVNAHRFPLDIHESDNAYVVIASLPGFKTDDLNISLNDDVLTISAERLQEAPQEGFQAALTERRNGKFSRSIRLPYPVNADAVDATLDAGVLTLTLPKTPEAQPRLITVKSGVNGSPSNN